MPTVLVTGSSGLVGSACVRHFASQGWEVHGLDSNARLDFFGPDGDTDPARRRLLEDCPGFTHHDIDVRDRADVLGLLWQTRPVLVVHAAAQPSHDYAAAYPFEDFETNAAGTLNVLEGCLRHAPGAAFVLLSTNKVYGDAVNRLPLVERDSRWDFAPDTPAGRHGVGEWLGLDASLHSLFGCSKLAADVYTQEYGRYFGLKTCVLRCGCLTGGGHAGAEQHGFLAYLAKCCRAGRPYRVYGHGGKQVRDQLHADDVARACEAVYKGCGVTGEAYNLGGGRENSLSVREAIAAVERRSGRRLAWEYVDGPRRGDHVVWITDTRKFREHYPGWSVTRDLPSILDDLCGDGG